MKIPALTAVASMLRKGRNALRFAFPTLTRRWRRRLPGRFQAYGHTFADRYPWLFRFAAANLGGGEDIRILSFGCSRGDEVFTLRHYFPAAEIQGIDVDPRNIALCRSRLRAQKDARTAFLTAATTEGEPAESYDAIFCLAVLCLADLTISDARRCDPWLYFADFERVVADFARCLKPGGLLLMHTANFRFSDTAAARDFDAVFEAEPEQLAPDLLFDRDNRRLQGVRNRAVAFRKHDAPTSQATHRCGMSPLAVPFHRRYLTLVADIERGFPVGLWKSGDVEIWPLARMDLYLDMYWAKTGAAAPTSAPLALRTVAHIATPLTNIWKSRRDLAHWVVRPRSAHAIFLGDGVSLDCVDGAWQDRFGEPLIAALEERGLGTFLMQSGDLGRLPWRRPTFAANVIAVLGAMAAASAALPVYLPEHEKVLEFLNRSGVVAPSLAASRLARRARNVRSTASAFEQVLRRVQPTIAFVVTYYAGLGPAFLLACRRQGILSVDLQHCPQEGTHKAYGWLAVPKNGYATLPAIFWNWKEEDAADIRTWAETLELPWHRSVHGGHTQVAAFLNDLDPRTKGWDAKFHSLSGMVFEREILVALQPIAGHRAQWDAVAAQIESAPRDWRWWIRRHPASRAYQDADYQQLLSLNRPNVIVEQAASLPLPALLRHMSVLVSLASGAAAEAAVFGVPALFLSDEAHGTFPGLIERGVASVIDARTLNREIARVAAVPVRSRQSGPPALAETVFHLEQAAREYSQLCRGGAGSSGPVR